ncbi:hypothetical protein ACNKHL_09855 [Shigella flexneri]
MSGTSLDGVDVVLARIHEAPGVYTAGKLELADSGVSETGCTGYLPGPAAYTFRSLDSLILNSATFC